MKYGITGATGLLGGNLAISLLEQGHQVVATKRKSSKTGHLSQFSIEWVDASLGDSQSLVDAFAGCDGVFHCAAAVSIMMKVQPWIYEANIIGTENVIQAIQSLPNTRLVHCSSVVAVGVSQDGIPYDETAKWNVPELGLGDAYAVTKRKSEEMVLGAVAEKNIDAVVINPAYIIGPYDSKPSSGKLIVDYIKGKIPGYPPGINNFVAVRDVVQGMIAAMEKGVKGERYILSGHNMRYKEFWDKVSDIDGKTKPLKRQLPFWLARLAGWFGDFQGWITGKEPLVNTATIRWSHVDFVFASDKAQRELGYTISPIEPAIQDAIDWFRQNDILP